MFGEPSLQFMHVLAVRIAALVSARRDARSVGSDPPGAWASAKR